MSRSRKRSASESSQCRIRFGYCRSFSCSSETFSHRQAAKIDGLFQAPDTPPALHVIIEAHPDVLQHIRNLGYYDRPGVKILEGKWQDFVDKQDILGIGGFDIVYTDTFSEDYSDLHKFFEILPDLLSGPESRFSFFNGLGATSERFFSDFNHIISADASPRFVVLRRLYSYRGATSLRSRPRRPMARRRRLQRGR